MLYEIDLSKIPFIEEAHKHERKTVWRCSHRRNSLVYFTEGSCTFKINNKEKLVEEGSAILIPAGAEYERRPVNDLPATFIYVHFMANVNPIPSAEAEEKVRQLIKSEANDNANLRQGNDHAVTSTLLVHDITKVKDRGYFEKLLDDVIEDFASSVPFGRIISSLKLGEALVHLSRQELISYAYPVTVEDRDKTYPAPLNNALIYIKENFNRKITVPDLCSASNVTPQHIIRLFNKHLNETPIKYINRTKILSAIEMLRSTDLSVKEISYELGFDNPNYFSRIFTREVGMSPIEKRNNMRNYRKPEDTAT